MRALLRQFWFQSLLLVGLLAIVIWFLGPLWVLGGNLPLQSEFNRLLAILLVVIGWGLNNFRMQLLERRDEEQLREAVAGPAAETGGEALRSMEQRLHDTLDQLEQLPGMRGRFLQRVPWFMFIGPPGAGKSTALANCQIDFLQAGEGEERSALRGVGGTRDCEWWFCKDAVMLDTAGRYTIQENKGRDAREWQAFLDLLERHRGARSVHGVIMVINTHDLLTLRASQREAHAMALRARLLELTRGLSVRLPVYVLLTKADLVAGFRETFDYLSAAERHEVFGVTLPREDAQRPSDALEILDEEYRRMVNRLAYRAFGEMAREKDPRKRRLIFRFPQQVGSLAEPLRHVLGLVFGSGRGIAGAQLRGLYFSSGTQRGAPIDRLMARVAGGFGFQLRDGGRQYKSSRSFFLGDLFREVLFVEARGTVRDDQRHGGARRRLFGYGVLTAVMLFLAVSLVRLAGVSSQVFDSIESAINVPVVLQPGAPSIINAAERAAALDRAAAVAGPYRLPGGNWLYSGFLQLVPLAENARDEIAWTRLMPALLDSAQRIALAEGGDSSLRALRVYRMLTGNEARADASVLRWLQQDRELLRLTEEQIGLVRRVLEKALAAHPERTLPADPEFMLQYRQTQSTLTVGDRVFELLNSGSWGQPVEVAELLGDDWKLGFRLAKRNTLLTRMLTPEGWREGFVLRMPEAISATIGGAGSGAPPSVEQLARTSLRELVEELMLRYQWQQLAAWEDLIAALQPRAERDLAGILNLFQSLAGTHSPLQTLGHNLREATRPVHGDDPAVQAALGRALQAWPEILRREFLQSVARGVAGVELDSEFGRLRAMADPSAELVGLRDRLQRVVDAPDAPRAAFELLRQQLGAGTSDAFSAWQSSVSDWPQRPRSWVRYWADAAQRALAELAADHVNAMWGDGVGSRCREVVQKFPFVRDADAADAEVLYTLFEGRDSIEAFRREHLAALESAQIWRLRDEALAMFSAAARVRMELVGEGGEGAFGKLAEGLESRQLSRSSTMREFACVSVLL